MVFNSHYLCAFIKVIQWFHTEARLSSLSSQNCINRNIFKTMVIFMCGISMHTCSSMRTCMCVQARGQYRVSSLVVSTLCFEAVSLTNPSSPFCSDGLPSSELWGSLAQHPITGLQNGASGMASSQVLGILIRPSGLCSKLLTNGTVSPTSKTVSI